MTRPAAGLPAREPAGGPARRMPAPVSGGAAFPFPPAWKDR
jgi:hypothetical protein